MIHPSSETFDQEIEQQTRLVRGLIACLYARIDPDPEEPLLREPAEARQTLRELQQRRDVTRAEAEKAKAGPGQSMGMPLGPETTGLRVVSTTRFQPTPPESITCSTRGPRRASPGEGRRWSPPTA